MAIKLIDINFGVTHRTGSVATQSTLFNFNGEGTVKQASVMLAGFEVHFDNGDHHFFQEQIQLKVVSTRSNVVEVVATLLLRDGSGNIDDPFSGIINAVVIVDVV